MELDHDSIKSLTDYGFKLYKSKKYIQVRDDMVFLISFEGKKKDIYIWHAVYPLAQPNISLGKAWGKYAGRVPELEGQLSITDSSPIEHVSANLAELITSTIIPIFTSIQSLRDTADSFSPGSPSAFSYFALGDYHKGIELLYKYKAFREAMSKHTTVEPEIAEFINNVSPSNINQLLESFRNNNIKKLRLSSFV